MPGVNSHRQAARRTPPSAALPRPVYVSSQSDTRRQIPSQAAIRKAFGSVSPCVIAAIDGAAVTVPHWLRRANSARAPDVRTSEVDSFHPDAHRARRVPAGARWLGSRLLFRGSWHGDRTTVTWLVRGRPRWALWPRTIRGLVPARRSQRALRPPRN